MPHRSRLGADLRRSGAHRGSGSATLLASLLSVLTIACGGSDISKSDLRAPEAALLDPDRIPTGYVGNEACLPCHGEIVTEFQGTKKNRSLIPFDPDQAPERFEPGATVFNPGTDLHYRAFLRGTRLVQRESRVDDEGRPLHELDFEADLVIGSGNQTRSYLMTRNGRVTQMPLTWYSQSARWDMSPGYDEANDRFGRKIILECLNCHASAPERSPYTQNHYVGIPAAIGCERCHGPGEAHVVARSGGAPGITGEAGAAVDGTAGAAATAGLPDPSIVNPARLDRDRELSVCAQCHMAGVMSYLPGEGAATFVPGMHLAEHRTVHVPELQLTDPEWVGIDSHPVRLARSACFQASQMTCASCHLPHTPDSDLPADHYPRSCLACHAGEDHGAGIGTACSRPEVASGAEASSGDCVTCHMQKGGTTDVPHVRFTDHWIRRTLDSPLDPGAGRPVIESATPLRLVVLSPRGTLASPELYLHLSESVRLAMEAEAYFHFYETMHRHPGYLPRVVESGRRALSAGAGTAGGNLALGRALLELDSIDAAEAALRSAMDEAPRDPWAPLLLGALLEERRGAAEEGIGLLRRAVGLQPELLEARTKLADALQSAGRIGEARAELEEVVRRDPVHEARSWFNLGVLRQQGSDEAGAYAAFVEASRLDPDLVAAHLQRGAIELARGELEGAETRFRAAIRADPSDPAGHGSLALIHLERGQWEAARARLLRVLELDPGNPGAVGLLEELSRIQATPPPTE